MKTIFKASALSNSLLSKLHAPTMIALLLMIFFTSASNQPIEIGETQSAFRISKVSGTDLDADRGTLKQVLERSIAEESVEEIPDIKCLRLVERNPCQGYLLRRAAYSKT